MPGKSAWWVRLVSAVPMPLLYVLASLLAWLAFRAIPYRPKVVRENLRIAFPELCLLYTSPSPRD